MKNLHLSRFVGSLVLLLGLVAWIPAGKPIVMPAGTLVILETTMPLSSRDAQVGQTLTLRAKFDVMIKGRIAIKGGAIGSAQVTSVAQRKGMGKEGSLTIRPTVVQAVDGQMVPLTSNGNSSSGNETKAATVGLAVVVSPLFLLKKGKDATLPPGYELQASVASETTIE
jgi:hypothetical protein